MKNIVVFTGAGISAESGLGTFRDSGGLWEEYKIEEVAAPEAFQSNPKLVLDFYNLRRRQLLKTKPNQAHHALNRLRTKFNLSIITQNIDDLHERSGSENVLHLHGKLRESKSTLDYSVFPVLGTELNLGEFCPKGAQLRPNVVWFGESVPKMEEAINLVLQADIFIIIGTSLNVYPAASLLNYAKKAEKIIIIDPNADFQEGIETLQQKASTAVPKLVDDLLCFA